MNNSLGVCATCTDDYSRSPDLGSLSNCKADKIPKAYENFVVVLKLVNFWFIVSLVYALTC